MNQKTAYILTPKEHFSGSMEHSVELSLSTRTLAGLKESSLMEDDPELMTIEETAVYMRMPVPTVYYLAGRGELPGIKIGGRWRIKRSLLDRDVMKCDWKKPERK